MTAATFRTAENYTKTCTSHEVQIKADKKFRLPGQPGNFSEPTACKIHHKINGRGAEPMK